MPCAHFFSSPLIAMAWAFDPAKYQSQEPQNKHFHFQKVHQGDTCGKNEECEAGQLLMSLQERPEKKKHGMNLGLFSFVCF